MSWHETIHKRGFSKVAVNTIDQALAAAGYELVPIGKVPKGWRIFLERLPVESGPCWQATIRPHGEDGVASEWRDRAGDALYEVINMIAAAKGEA